MGFKEICIAYGRWNKLPEAGYELLPKFFWVWSEVEAQAIDNWNRIVKQWHQPYIGGNPWLNLWGIMIIIFACTIKPN